MGTSVCLTVSCLRKHFTNRRLTGCNFCAESKEANVKAVAMAVDAAGELPPGPLRNNIAEEWQRRMWWSPKLCVRLFVLPASFFPPALHTHLLRMFSSKQCRSHTPTAWENAVCAISCSPLRACITSHIQCHRALLALQSAIYCYLTVELLLLSCYEVFSCFVNSLWFDTQHP